MIKNFLADLKTKGWTQEGIAEKTGIPQTMISRYVRGKTCTLETLCKFADAFQVTTDTVLGRTGVRKGGNNYHGPERRKTERPKAGVA
jgi:transcriptional regulator with XRE-family HTH domain